MSESNDLSARWQLYLRIAAQIAVEIDSNAVYREELFPVVEFAMQADRWAGNVGEDGPDFTYQSIESDEPALLWFRRGSDGWKIGSSDGPSPVESCSVPLFAITGAVRDYYDRLRADVLSAFRRDINTLRGWMDPD